MSTRVGTAKRFKRMEVIFRPQGRPGHGWDVLQPCCDRALGSDRRRVRVSSRRGEQHPSRGSRYVYETDVTGTRDISTCLPRNAEQGREDSRVERVKLAPLPQDFPIRNISNELLTFDSVSCKLRPPQNISKTHPA